MSGKSPELLALEQCLPMTVEFLSGAVVDLRWFGGKLMEGGLITQQAVNAALERQGGMEKGNQLMSAVVAQVSLDNGCFARFLAVLKNETALDSLNQKFMSTFGKRVLFMGVWLKVCIGCIRRSLCNIHNRGPKA